MGTKNVWSLLLGISDADWERAQSRFQHIAAEFLSFREKLDSAARELTIFVEKHRPGIEKFLSLLQDKDLINKIFCDYLSSIHKRLLKHGYFIGLSGWGFSYTNEINKLLDQGNQNAIDEYLLGLLRNKDNVNQIYEKWNKNDYFKPRSRFLLRGIKAHFEEDYIASVPILLPHIESILAEYFVVAGLLADTPEKFCGNKALNLLKTISIDEICTEIDKVNFRRFLNSKGVFDFKPDENSYLNRGSILHGTCLCYDQEKWSAQLIYLLDFLCDLTSVEPNLFIEQTGKRILKRKKVSDT